MENHTGMIRSKVEGLVAAVGFRQPSPEARPAEAEDDEDPGHLSEMESLDYVPDFEENSGNPEARHHPNGPEPPQNPEAPQQPEPEEETQDWQTQRILKKLRIIHANLGHPSNQVLCRMLKDAGAGPETLRLAEQYACPYCAKRGHAQPHRTSQVPHATRKWEVVSVDTFWWHSPHKDEKGNPIEHVVGVSFLDEATDYHVASIVRTGSRTQKVISSEEFKDVLCKDWLRILPKPQCLRFDDEGAFRDMQTIEWIEGNAIHVSVIAGEAAWQVGKHSRHLEVLKENMSLLAAEVGPEVTAKELLGRSLGAKNELHNVSGYTPNQWAFGQERNRIQSYLQNGNHLPTQSLRQAESFEEGLQKEEAARRAFLKADSRRRILRAARGHARKNQRFEAGQLVYFYRKGRHTSKLEAGWHGPARVVAVEKQGGQERNQTQGSVVWIAHATVMYRCAPEQLRLVPPVVEQLYQEKHGNQSAFEQVRQGGNHANYRDISQDLAQEPIDAEIHSDEPGSGTKFPIPIRRVFGKRHLEHGEQQEGSPEESQRGEAGGQGIRGSEGAHGRAESLPPAHHGGSRQGGAHAREVLRSPGGGDLQEPQLRDVDRGASRGEPSLSSPDRVCLPEGAHQGDQDERQEFWRRADARRDSDRVGRDHEQRGDSRGRHEPRNHGQCPGRDHQVPQGADRTAGTSQSAAAGGIVPGHVSHHEPPEPDGGGQRAHHPERGREGQNSRSVNRDRSRTPHGELQSGMISIHEAIDEGLLDDIPEEVFVLNPEDVVEDQVCNPEESVGNALDLSHGNLGERIQGIQGRAVQLGCFEWQRADPTWEALPRPKQLGMSLAKPEKPNDLDNLVYFQQSLERQTEVFEISMDIQARDVHKVPSKGKGNWVLNDKPKKRAEVNFRSLTEEDKLEFLQAMKGELGSYLEHEAIDIARRHNVPPDRILGMRWVLSWKAIEGPQGDIVGKKPKARLIVKGFQDPDLLKLRRDSPTLTTHSRNMLLSLCSSFKWKAYVGDIRTAFLNGDHTEEARQVFADPPEEVRKMLNMRPHEIFRIRKAIYGLPHAPREWALKLGRELQNQGWIQSKLEPCVWRLYDSSDSLCGLIGIHVDDLLCCGHGSFFEDRMQALRGSFPFGSWRDLQESPSMFCGCEIHQKGDFTIELNQERYAEGLSEIPLCRERREQGAEPATEGERKLLRAALGALSWRATQSAPWLAASVSYLQGCFNEATVDDLLQANKLIRLQRTFSQAVIRFSSKIKRPMLLTYHDASHACRRDGSSQGGLITMLVDESILEGNQSHYSPIAWQSRKLPRVCRSSTSAEVQTGSHAMDAHEFTKQMMIEWFNRQPIAARDMDQVLSQVSSVVVTDSKNMFDSVVRVETSGLQLEEKRLALEVLSIRERVKATGIQFRWVDSDQQLADGLSKPFSYTSLVTACQRATISIQFDSQFISAKKKRAHARRLAGSKIPETHDQEMNHRKEDFHQC